jgi:hypothetical protein
MRSEPRTLLAFMHEMKAALVPVEVLTVMLELDKCSNVDCTGFAEIIMPVANLK